MASLVREALSEYVARRQEAAAPPVRFLAAGRSGREDVSELSEEIVFAELAPHGTRGASPARRRTKR